MQTDAELTKDLLKATEDIQLGIVTPEWISGQMKRLKMKPVDISLETGIDTGTISKYLCGKRVLLTMPKAFFYYYFKSKS